MGGGAWCNRITSVKVKHYVPVMRRNELMERTTDSKIPFIGCSCSGHCGKLLGGDASEAWLQQEYRERMTKGQVQGSIASNIDKAKVGLEMMGSAYRPNDGCDGHKPRKGDVICVRRR